MTAQPHTPLGVLQQSDDHPTVMVIEPLEVGYPLRDQFNGLVHRQGNRLTVDSRTHPFWKMEYCGQNAEPADFVVDYGDFLVRYQRVKHESISPQLYLVHYEETMEFKDALDDASIE